MPLLVLLCIFCSVLGAQNVSQAPKHIMFISPPAHSHVSLLREIAVGVKEEYPLYRVSFVTGGKYLKMIDAVSSLGIEAFNGLIPGEDCLNIGSFPKEMALEHEKLDPGHPAFFSVVLEILPRGYDCMFDPIEALIQKEKPDFLVLDIFAMAGRDLAVRYNLDYAVLGLLGVGGVAPELWLPPSDTGSRLEDMHDFVFRAKNLAAFFGMLTHLVPLMTGIQRPRQERGFPPLAYGDMNQDRLVIIPEIWGFNYARPIPPLLHHVGFLPVPHDSPRSSIFTNTENDKALFDWLDSLPEDSFVIYVAFGSHLTVSQQLIVRIIHATLRSDPNIIVLAALRDKETTTDSIPAELRVRLRRESWIPQARLLRHRHVKLFISHGGLSSLSESIHADVPMIIFPFFGDQPRNGYQLQASGAGFVFIHTKFVDQDLMTGIRTIRANYSSFASATAKLRQISELEGGRKEAARAIHKQVTLGRDHLKNIELQFSAVERYNLDFLAIFLTLVYVVYRLFKTLFCYCCCSKKESKNTKAKQE